MSIFDFLRKRTEKSVEPQVRDQETEAETNVEAEPGIYNLIILDESGSMGHVRRQTISGCNETLNGIRNNAKEHPEQKQFVSIYCFDTANPRYLFKNKPIEQVADLTEDDYLPNACTPLYDAIGLTVTDLKKVVKDSDSNAMVTIITDGLENSSKRWNHSAVVELIESLKKKGWVFTFIGANIDVEQTSRSLGINSFMEFQQTDEGMRNMFNRENRSRQAYYAKTRYMRSRAFFNESSEERQMGMSGALNDNYFTEDERVAPKYISDLAPDEIFVFGSNIDGIHSGGAALFALKHFGAEFENPEGRQGQSYAIPTVGNTLEELTSAVERFTDYAVQNPRLKFMLTEIGCGSAGYKVEQIAPLFRIAYSFGNIYVPESFLPYVK